MGFLFVYRLLEQANDVEILRMPALKSKRMHSSAAREAFSEVKDSQKRDIEAVRQFVKKTFAEGENPWTGQPVREEDSVDEWCDPLTVLPVPPVPKSPRPP